MSHSPCEVCLAEDPSENDKTGWGLLDEHVDSHLASTGVCTHKVERQKYAEAHQQVWSLLFTTTISNIT